MSKPVENNQHERYMRSMVKNFKETLKDVDSFTYLGLATWMVKVKKPSIELSTFHLYRWAVSACLKVNIETKNGKIRDLKAALKVLEDDIKNTVQPAKLPTSSNESRYSIFTKITQKNGWDKTICAPFFFANNTDPGGVKRMQEKINAKATKSILPAEVALIQCMELLKKEGYDIENVAFDEQGKMKLKKY